MKETITQKDLYLLLPIKVSGLAYLLGQDRGISVVDAIRQVYSSSTYKEMEREESKAWCLGPTTLYHDLKQELNNKKVL